MPKFNEVMGNLDAKIEEEKKHQISDAIPTTSRFLKDDPYYKLIEEKKPKAYREHLFYPENGKLALHGTKGEKLGDFDTEEEITKFVDEKYKPFFNAKPTSTNEGKMDEIRKEEEFNPTEPLSLEELRKKYGERVAKSFDDENAWIYTNPYKKGSSWHKNEVDALKYAEKDEGITKEDFKKRADNLISGYKEGKYSAKELSKIARDMDYYDRGLLIEALIEKLGK